MDEILSIRKDFDSKIGNVSVLEKIDLIKSEQIAICQKKK